MNIAYVSTLTEDYVLGLKVFIKSILQNNPSLSFDYVVFEEGNISKESKLELLAIYKNFKFKRLNPNKYANMIFSGMRDWRINPANRLEILTLSEYDKIVFFDVDMLCTGDISELHTLPGDFLACHDFMPEVDCVMLGFTEGFNGGVMVIGKQYLCQHTIDSMTKLMRSKEWLGNQSAFNVYFRDIHKLLPDEYFLNTINMNMDTFQKAKIYHFAGDIKPWQNLNAHTSDINYLNQKYCSYVLAKSDHILLRQLLIKYNKILKTVL